MKIVKTLTYKDDEDKVVDKYSGEYIFETWTFGEKLDSEEAAITIKDAKTGDISVSTKSIEISKFLSCIKKCPFELTEKELMSLPSDLGELLRGFVNKVTAIKKKSSIIITD